MISDVLDGEHPPPMLSTNENIAVLRISDSACAYSGVTLVFAGTSLLGSLSSWILTPRTSWTGSLTSTSFSVRID